MEIAQVFATKAPDPTTTATDSHAAPTTDHGSGFASALGHQMSKDTQAPTSGPPGASGPPGTKETPGTSGSNGTIDLTKIAGEANGKGPNAQPNLLDFLQSPQLQIELPNPFWGKNADKASDTKTDATGTVPTAEELEKMAASLGIPVMMPVQFASVDPNAQSSTPTPTPAAPGAIPAAASTATPLDAKAIVGDTPLAAVSLPTVDPSSPKDPVDPSAARPGEASFAALLSGADAKQAVPGSEAVTGQSSTPIADKPKMVSLSELPKDATAPIVEAKKVDVGPMAVSAAPDPAPTAAPAAAPESPKAEPTTVVVSAEPAPQHQVMAAESKQPMANAAAVAAAQASQPQVTTPVVVSKASGEAKVETPSVSESKPTTLNVDQKSTTVSSSKDAPQGVVTDQSPAKGALKEGSSGFGGEAKDSSRKSSTQAEAKVDVPVASSAGDTPNSVPLSGDSGSAVSTEPRAKQIEQSKAVQTADTGAVDRYQVVRQVADRIEMLAASKSTDGVVVHLEPKNLGTITLVVKNVASNVDAQVTASDNRVRDALQQSRPELGAALQQRGFNLNNVSISSSQTSTQLSNHGETQQKHQQPSQQQSQGQSGNKFPGGHVKGDSLNDGSQLRRSLSGGVDVWI